MRTPFRLDFWPLVGVLGLTFGPHFDGVFGRISWGKTGGTRILPSSALWRRTPRRPQGHTMETLDEQIMAQQKEMDEEKFAAESIPATGEPGDMLVYIGQVMTPPQLDFQG